jgi:hypothetical protein
MKREKLGQPTYQKLMRLLALTLPKVEWLLCVFLDVEF